MPLSYQEVVDHPIFSEPPFRWRMGVRSLAAHEWLQPDDRRSADLAEKELLTRQRRDAVFAAQARSEPASVEIHDLVVDALAGHELAPVAARRHPLETAGLSVQEDLCLLEPVGSSWVLTAGSVCFPTRWDLRAVLGSSLAAIHSPVPSYDRHLDGRVDRFFDRMVPGAVAHRLNWSLVGDSARRLEPEARQAPTALPDDPATGLHLRVERQTLRRLVGHRAIVFGIRIHVWPLGEVVDHVGAATLAQQLVALPEAVAHYKDLDGFRHELTDWLRGI
jgi:hypothetical protein